MTKYKTGPGFNDFLFKVFRSDNNIRSYNQMLMPALIGMFTFILGLIATEENPVELAAKQAEERGTPR